MRRRHRLNVPASELAGRRQVSAAKLSRPRNGCFAPPPFLDRAFQLRSCSLKARQLVCILPVRTSFFCACKKRCSLLKILEKGDRVRERGKEPFSKGFFLFPGISPYALITRRCAAKMASVPFFARSSKVLSSSREKGSSSAVPWISTNFPDSVMITFISTSAAESST